MWRAAGRRGEPRGVRVAHREADSARRPDSAAAAAMPPRRCARCRRSGAWSSAPIVSARSRPGSAPTCRFSSRAARRLVSSAATCCSRLIDWPASWVVLRASGFRREHVRRLRWWDRDRRRRGQAVRRGGRVARRRTRQRSRGAGRRAGTRRSAQLVEALRGPGASYAAMSGSGSAVFGLFGDRASAESAAGRAEGLDPAGACHPHADSRRASAPRSPGPGGVRVVAAPVRRAALSVDKQATCRRNEPIVYTYRLRHVASATPEVSFSQFREVSDATAVWRTCCGPGPGACDARSPGVQAARAKAGSGDDGAWPSGKARDFGSRIRRFESFRPSQFARAVT